MASPPRATSGKTNRYLKLLPQLRRVALGVDLQHLLVGGRELADGDGGLSAQTGLQYGVVDEDVLLLRGGGDGEEKHP